MIHIKVKTHFLQISLFMNCGHCIRGKNNEKLTRRKPSKPIWGGGALVHQYGNYLIHLYFYIKFKNPHFFSWTTVNNSFQGIRTLPANSTQTSLFALKLRNSTPKVGEEWGEKKNKIVEGGTEKSKRSDKRKFGVMDAFEKRIFKPFAVHVLYRVVIFILFLCRPITLSSQLFLDLFAISFALHSSPQFFSPLFALNFPELFARSFTLRPPTLLQDGGAGGVLWYHSFWALLNV